MTDLARRSIIVGAASVAAAATLPPVIAAEAVEEAFTPYLPFSLRPILILRYTVNGIQREMRMSLTEGPGGLCHCSANMSEAGEYYITEARVLIPAMGEFPVIFPDLYILMAGRVLTMGETMTIHLPVSIT